MKFKIALTVLTGFVLALGIGVLAFAEPKGKECTPAPAAYAGLKISDCGVDPRTNVVGCSYGLCMKTPDGLTWCGAVLLLRDRCEGPFVPTYMQLKPKEPEPENHDKEL